MKKRMVSLLLSLAMLLSLLPATALPSLAADPVGTVDGTSYTNATSFVNAFRNSSSDHVVHLYADLTVDDRIVVGNDGTWSDTPADLTIYMHGHMITRSTSGSYKNVFFLIEGSNLTLIGSDNATEAATTHTVKGYDNSGNLTVDLSSEITGAVITGSNYNDADCGAICMKGNNTVSMQNVTVVGNRNGSTRYGGGIRVRGDGCTINMENSRICYNYSGQHGGGIRVDSGSVSSTYYCTINMENSSIDHNYAGYNGGGIQADGVVTLIGDGNSYIAWNECGGRANDNNVGGGGGIDCYYGGSVFKNLIIENNKTNSYQGGGICCEGTKGTTISGCTIRYNRATSSTYGYGGGVYLKHDSNSLADCYIYGNEANSRANGDGVYLLTDNLYLGGYLEIKNNGVMTRNASGVVTSDTPATEGTNLYLASGAYITPSLDNTSDIHITVADPSTSRKLSAGKGTYYPYCYSYDEVSSGTISHPATPTYGFRWYNEDPSDSKYRDLYLVSHATAVEAVPAETAVEAPDSVTELSNLTVESTQYKQIKTWYTAPSGTQALKDSDAVCFYSDGYFFRDRNVYNEQLSTMSFALVMAGFYANLGTAGTVLGSETLTDSVYYNKHAHVRQLLANIGCEDESIYMNNFNRVEPGMDSIGVAIAHKELLDASGNSTGKILVPVVIRSSGYGAEWASNFSMGTGSETTGGELLGFAMAANMAYSNVVDYVHNYGLDDAAADGNLIFWVVGYSRGGATANLTAKRLLAGSSPEIDISSVLGNTDTDFTGYLKSGTTDTMASRSLTLGSNQVVCYTFEAAQGGTDAAETAANLTINDLKCIHNVINAADVVPMVGTSAMGFKRYGVDHYVPGTATGSVRTGGQVVETDFSNGTLGIQAVSGVTSWRDNDPIYLDTTANSAYMNLRADMVKHFLAVNPYSVFDDYFHAAKISWVRGNLPIFSEPFNGTTSANLKVEGYLTDLVTKMQDWKITSRNWYTTQLAMTDSGTTYTYDSFQNAIRDAVDVFFGMSPEKTSEAINDLKAVLNGIGIFGDYINAGDLWNLYNDVLSNWPNLSDSRKIYYFDWTWGIVEKTGALSVFTDAQVADLKAAWPTIADVLFTFLYSDKESSAYGTSDVNQRFGTLLYNYSRILTNHYGETVMAWLRASDSNYNGEISGTVKRYTITQPTAAEIAVSAVAVNDDNGERTNVISGTTADCYGPQTLHLNSENVIGEAIYYSTDNGATWNLYEDGVGVTLPETGTVSVKAYAISYGQKSAEATFTLQKSVPQEYYLDDGCAEFTYNGAWSEVTEGNPSNGHAHKVTVSSSDRNYDYAKNVTFTFTGEGFRLWTDTSCKSGMVLVRYSYDDNGTTVTKSKYISLYRGYADYDETAGQWVPIATESSSAAEKEAAYDASYYHQIPAISMDVLEKDGSDNPLTKTYTVTVAPFYNSLVDKVGYGESEFIVDGVTIVNPEGHGSTYQYTSFHDALGATGTLSTLDLEGPYVFINTANLPSDWYDNNGVTRVYFFYKYNNNANTVEAWATALIPTATENVYAVRKPAVPVGAENFSNPSDPGDRMGSRWTHMIIVNSTEGSALGWGSGSCRKQTVDIALSNGNYISQINSEIGTTGEAYGKLWSYSQSSLNVIDDGAMYIDVSRLPWWNEASAKTSVCFQEFSGNNYVGETWATAELADSLVYGDYLYKVEIPSGNWTKMFVFRGDAYITSWSGSYWNRSAQILLSDELNVATLTPEQDNEGAKYSSLSALAATSLAGGVMIDGVSGGTTDVETILENGPKNLLYLGANQALIFTVGGNGGSAIPSGNCGVGVKALQGLTGKLGVYSLDNTAKTLTRLADVTVDHYSDDYEPLTAGENLQGKTILIYNAGSAPIALSRLRGSGLSSPITMTFTSNAVLRGRRMLRGLQDGTLVPIEPGENQPTEYFVGNSLSLDGDIGVNFYLRLSEEEAAGAVVELAWASGTETVAVAGLTPAANGAYVLTARVAAKEMTDLVTATLKQGDTVLESNSFSVADYANRILENRNGEFDGLFAEEGKLERLQALCRAMLIYGAKAQVLFAYQQDAPADASLADSSLAILTAEELALLGENDVPDLSDYGLEFCGSSLILETKTTYRLYFTVTDAEKLAGLTVFCGETELPHGEKDGMLYFDLENISAAAVLDPITVRFGTLSGSFTPGSYIYGAVSIGNEELEQTVTALYRFCQAAKDYFNQ